MKVRALSFNDDPEGKARLYACGKCGQCYSPKVYACAEPQAHEAAQKAAEKCCAPTHCTGCGVEVEKYWTACSSCREKNALRRATRILARDYHGPVEYDGMSGSWGEGYSGDTDELLQAWEDEYWVEIGPQVSPPAYCWPCTSQPLRLDAESLLGQAVDGMHEDAADEIVDADELVAFIEAWNAKQTCRSWYPDRSRVVVLNQEKFEELLK